jgi:hypothetical protein
MRGKILPLAGIELRSFSPQPMAVQSEITAGGTIICDNVVYEHKKLHLHDCPFELKDNRCQSRFKPESSICFTSSPLTPHSDNSEYGCSS